MSGTRSTRRSSTPVRRALATGLLAGAALVFSVDAARAQATDPAVLNDRLATLREQLAVETDARTEADARRSSERTALEHRRAELADVLLEQELRRRRLAAERRTLLEQRNTTGAQADSLARALDGLRRSTLEASEQVVQLQREIPGEEAALERLERLEDALRLETGAEAGHGAASLALWDALDRLHRRGGEVAVERLELWTAAGRRETVDLLSAGLVAFAYRTTDGQRVAFALSSPAEASGYRWSENLDPDLDRALRTAFEAARSGSERFLDVPIDVTGRVPATSVAPSEGLLERLRSGGRVMVPLALVAIVALAVILERVFFLFVLNGIGRTLTAGVLAAARAGRFAEAEQACQRCRGTVAAVLAACLRRHAQGPQAMEDSIQEQLLHEAPPLQRFLTGLGILAAVAPLLGLLGTVTGIIRTFGVIRVFGNANPGLMAGGISEALVTTATGLTIAIPILLVRGLLRGRVDRILSYAEKGAASLLNALVHDARQEADG